MKKIGIAILLALVFMGGCKTSKKSPKTDEEITVVTDSTAQKVVEVSTPPTQENEKVEETETVVQEIDETPEVRAFPQGVLMAHINSAEILEAMPENAKAEKELFAL